jgi:hypothetical protein
MAYISHHWEWESRSTVHFEQGQTLSVKVGHNGEGGQEPMSGGGGETVNRRTGADDTARLDLDNLSFSFRIMCVRIQTSL